jgi:phosphoenolpyruvate-protein kinase (PTS system EI component)
VIVSAPDGGSECAANSAPSRSLSRCSLVLGVGELSVSAAAVGAVKQAVRATDVGKAARLAQRALELPSAESVRSLVRAADPG